MLTRIPLALASSVVPQIPLSVFASHFFLLYYCLGKPRSLKMRLLQAQRKVDQKKAKAKTASENATATSRASWFEQRNWSARMAPHRLFA